MLQRGRKKRYSLRQRRVFMRYLLMGVLIVAASLLAVLIAGLLENDYSFYYPHDEDRVETRQEP